MNPTIQGIPSFDGDWRFLSNFYPATVTMYGLAYPSVEHAFAAAKTTDPAQREAIRLAATPGQAKRLGRKVTLRPNWDTIRLDVMHRLLRRKFRAGTHLADLLLSTGSNALEEGNSWNDQFWGVTPSGIAGDYRGQNHLGILLMKVRAELQSV